METADALEEKFVTFALASREWQDEGARGLAKMVGGSDEGYAGWDKRAEGRERGS